MEHAEHGTDAQSHLFGGDSEALCRRKSVSSISRTDAGAFLTELDSSLAAVRINSRAVLDDAFTPTPQHTAAVRHLAMLDNTMAKYSPSATGPVQAGSLFMRWLVKKSGAKVRVAPTIVQDNADVRLVHYDEQKGRTKVVRVQAKTASAETFVRMCAEQAVRVEKHEHCTCTVVAMAKTPSMHGLVKNVVEPLTAAALHFKINDCLEAPRGFKLFQSFVKSRGRRSVVYRVEKDQSKPHVSGDAISSAFQYTSFDERCSVKDADRAQQVHYSNAPELYDSICTNQATVDRTAVERHCVRLQQTVGRFYSTSLTKRGVVTEEILQSVRVAKVQNTALREVQAMMDQLAKFVEAAIFQETSRRVKFVNMVADFTLDEENRWWLLQVKAFQIQTQFHTIPRLSRPIWQNINDQQGNKQRCQLCGLKLTSNETTAIPVRSAYFLIGTYRDAKLPLTEWASTFLSSFNSSLQADRLKLLEQQIFGCTLCTKLLEHTEDLDRSASTLTAYLSRSSNRDTVVHVENATQSSGGSSTGTANGHHIPFSARPPDSCPYQLIVTCHYILDADLPSYHRLRGRPARLVWSLGPHDHEMWFQLDYNRTNPTADDVDDAISNSTTLSGCTIPVKQTRMMTVLGSETDLRAYFGSKQCDMHLLVQQGDGLSEAMLDAFSILEGTTALPFAGLRFNKAADERVFQKVDLLLPMQCHTLGVVLIKLTVATVNIAQLCGNYPAWSEYSGQANTSMVADQSLFWPLSALSMPVPLPESWLAVMCRENTLFLAQNALQGTRRRNKEDSLDDLVIPAECTFPREIVQQVFDQQDMLEGGRVSVRQLALGLDHVTAAFGGDRYSPTSPTTSTMHERLWTTKQESDAVAIVVRFLWHILSSPAYPSAFPWTQLVGTLTVMWNERQSQFERVLSSAVDHTALREALIRSIAVALPPSSRQLHDSPARQYRRLELFIELFTGTELVCDEIDAGELCGKLNFAVDTLQKYVGLPRSNFGAVVPAASATEPGNGRSAGFHERVLDNQIACGVLAHNLFLCCAPLDDIFENYSRHGTGIVQLEQFVVLAESTVQDIGKSLALQQRLQNSSVIASLQKWSDGRDGKQRIQSRKCNCHKLCARCPITQAVCSCSVHGLSCFDLRDMFCLACEYEELSLGSSIDLLEQEQALSPPRVSPTAPGSREGRDTEMQFSLLTQTRARVRRESKLIRQGIDTQGLREHLARQRSISVEVIQESNSDQSSEGEDYFQRVQVQSKSTP